MLQLYGLGGQPLLRLCPHLDPTLRLSLVFVAAAASHTPPEAGAVTTAEWYHIAGGTYGISPPHQTTQTPFELRRASERRSCNYCCRECIYLSIYLPIQLLFLYRSIYPSTSLPTRLTIDLTQKKSHYPE